MSSNSAAVQSRRHGDSPSVHPVLGAVEFHDDRARRAVDQSGILGLGKAYEAGRWTTGDLPRLMDLLFTSNALNTSLVARGRFVLAAMESWLINRQAGRGAFRIGKEHYDLGNDLFECMLDDSMTYTCGYWAKAATLEEAQRDKLELICRKLDLKPGDRVLDIGCGWGNFARHAATHYGAHVTGITVSEKQANLARQRNAGLDIDIRLVDYRDVHEQFDHIVSIEMIEAVGRRNLPTYFGVIDRCLKPGGLCVIQAISGDTFSRTSDRRLDQFMLWLVKFIFPDGYLPRREELIPPADTRLRIEDWQRYFDDYNRTLLAWAERFNQGWDQIAHLYDDRFRRRWNFYLHGCAAAFRARMVDVYQIVYSKGGADSRYQPSR